MGGWLFTACEQYDFTDMPIMSFFFPKSTGWTALFFAAKEGHLEIARTLVKAGAHVLQKDEVCT